MQRVTRVHVVHKFDDGRGIRMPGREFTVPDYIADEWLRRQVVVKIEALHLSAGPTEIKRSRKIAHTPSRSK